MKKNIKILGISLFAFLLLMTGVIILQNIEFSYAIPTGVDRSGIPDETFTTNVSSTSTNNYVNNALIAAGASNELSSNFSVPSNVKDSSNSTPLYLLIKNYDVPTTSTNFEIIDSNPTSVTDNGILYILSHGYNTTNTLNNIFSTNRYGAVSDNNIKQYVTQIALWLYIYENKSNFSTTYCVEKNCDFLDSSDNAVAASSIRDIITTAGNVEQYNYLNYITLLVDNAGSYTGGENSAITSLTDTNLNYQINNNFTLLLTDLITPTVSSNSANFMYYSVEISDPYEYGAYIVDNNNERITNLNNVANPFKVAVPLIEDITSMDLSSIEIKVYGHFVKDEGYDYRVTSLTTGELTKYDLYSNVLLGYTPSETVETGFRLYNFVKISKTDITNSEELAGATLVLKDKSDDSEIETWVSTTTPHYTYLPDGEYTLCETIPPEDYVLNTECVDFTVDGSNIVAVEMKNQHIPDVPDTAKFTSKIIYLIGFVLIAFGVVITTLVISKKKTNQNN